MRCPGARGRTSDGRGAAVTQETNVASPVERLLTSCQTFLPGRFVVGGSRAREHPVR